MLFIAYRPRTSENKLGVPTFIDRLYTEEFNEKKPMEAIFSSISPQQLNYNPYRDGIPIPVENRLPQHLIMVCKGLTKFNSDFYVDGIRQWIVSEKFHNFMTIHNLMSNSYEICELTPVSTKNLRISDKNYFLLRFFSNDNLLVDLESSPKISSSKKPLTKKTPPTFYYPDFVFKNDAAVPPMLHLELTDYWPTFLCNAEIKALMEEEHFLGFDFYTLPEYVEERLYREKYPDGPPSDKPKRLS